MLEPKLHLLHVENVDFEAELFKRQTGVTIGIAFYPKNGKDTAELIQHADQSMYQVRKEDKNISFAK